jgi:predicted transcriptional regulator
VLGIDIRESEGAVRQFVEVNNDYNWTFLLDSTGVISNAYQVRSIPSSFFIDATGVIKATQIGAMSMSRMESLLAKAMQ